MSDSPLKRLLVHASHYGLTSVFTMIAGLVSFPLLTRLFSVRDYGATWYSAVPTMHRLLLARAGKTNERPAGSESLRFIRSCSAPLPAEMAQRMESIFGAPVLEAYGMTEASHQMASNPLPRAGAKADRQRNVGAAGFVTDRNASNISLLSDRRRCALWPREIRVCHADAIEDVRTEQARGRPIPILGQDGDGHAVVGEHDVDLVGKTSTTFLRKADPSILPALS